MNSKPDNIENVEGKVGKRKRFRSHLHVNTEIHPIKKDIDWNRKAHSSPIKGYHRRLSDQESSSGNHSQVSEYEISIFNLSCDIELQMLN